MPALPNPTQHTDPHSGSGAADAALLARIRQGDHQAFAAVFRAHYPLLAAVAARLSTPEQAEEIVQDVFLSLWERRGALDVDGSIRSYLLAAIRFASASAVRRSMVAERHRAAGFEFHAPPPLADAALMDDERARVITAAIDRLPERCRMVFVLVRVEGLSYADAAASLGIAEKTVDAQMGKALKRLRDDLRAFRR